MDKDNLIILFYIIPLAIAIFIYYYREHVKEQKAKTKKSPKVNLDGDQFISKLDQLDYFKYVDPEKLEELKSEMQESYENYGELATIENKDLPICHRLFTADAESIFEEGGFIEILRDLEAAFTIRKLKFDIEDHFEDYNDNTANQWVIVNDHKYIIYDNVSGTNSNWESATNELTDLLNTELEKQSSNDRIYTISGGNDARIIFLSKKQYEFIKTLNLQDGFMPQIANKHQKMSL